MERSAGGSAKPNPFDITDSLRDGLDFLLCSELTDTLKGQTGSWLSSDNVIARTLPKAAVDEK